MSWIIMGRDECNQEFRPNYDAFDSEHQAYACLEEARQRYQEARSLWVEKLYDKMDYLLKHQDYWDMDDWGDY